MNRRPLACLASLATLSVVLVAPASAADLGGYEGSIKDEPVVSAWSWTGFYAGLNAGYGFSDDDEVFTTGQIAVNQTNVDGGARPERVEVDPDGFIGGAQVGYNWQFSRFVVGVEADISYTDFDEETRVTTTALNGRDRLDNDFRSSLEYLATVRGRLGYAFDKTLVYVTAGLAFGEVENEVDMFGPAGQLQFTGRESETETGYTVGGGFEHAFGPRWSLKGEYLYYDLGDQTVAADVIPGSGGGGTGYFSEFETSGHVLRTGLNYRF